MQDMHPTHEPDPNFGPEESSSWLSFLIWGRYPGPSTYYLTRWLFLRLLGFVYLIAFLSIWYQVEGLLGSNGILPAGEFLESVQQRLGTDSYWRLPTLCWFNQSDAFLHALCIGGVTLSLLLMAGMAPILVLVGLWAAYLSLVNVGQDFLSFQWDTLLLETGFLSIFFAPFTLLHRWPSFERVPPITGLWLLRLLLFKLIVLSGLVKLLSMDPSWWNLTALNFHYYTQPLPGWISWYAHQLPEGVQSSSVMGMLIIEIGVPFLIFCPRGLRMLGCCLLVSLQAGIALTGNYCFFNLLTTVLCITLLDDKFLLSFLPMRLTDLSFTPPQIPTSGFHKTWRWVVYKGLPVLAMSALLFLSSLSFVREQVRTQPRDGIKGWVGKALKGGDEVLLSWAQPTIFHYTDGFHSVNGYGLFRVMTTSRPEIVLEGSADGQAWYEYGFPWKPGDVSRRPRFIAPHQPRLDWQMWFAALNPRGADTWLRNLVEHLLRGTPEVLALMGDNPFEGSPPQYVRLVYYSYEFTNFQERRASGDWWRRIRRGETPAFSR
ncbi:MAG: lipase maturation factor family protein [Planctomycetota bacterium]